MNTITFLDKDRHFVFTVKQDFLDQCTDPSNCDIKQLATFDLSDHLHSVTGPAVVYTANLPEETLKALIRGGNVNKIDGQVVAYWLEGELVTPEQWLVQRGEHLK